MYHLLANLAALAMQEIEAGVVGPPDSISDQCFDIPSKSSQPMMPRRCAPQPCLCMWDLEFRIQGVPAAILAALEPTTARLPGAGRSMPAKVLGQDVLGLVLLGRCQEF